jgi:hypothetical protein
MTYLDKMAGQIEENRLAASLRFGAGAAAEIKAQASQLCQNTPLAWVDAWALAYDRYARSHPQA